MRLIIATLACAAALVGCDRTPRLTAEQQRQVDAARSATVATSERLLGRTLSDSEKACIHVDFKNGRTVGSVSPPLSERLKERQAELLERAKQSK